MAKETAPSDLLKKHGLFKLPVNVDAVASALGIGVRTQSLEDGYSAFLLIKDGKATAFLNEDHHPNRRRFSLAHEIGHFVLHHKKNHLFLDKSMVMYTRKNSSSPEGIDPVLERQANEFASKLLMPDELLKKHIAKHDLDITDEFDISRLAVSFGVSEQALQIRLSNLGLAEPNF